MFLLEWTASDLLFMLVAAAAVIGTVLWLVPGVHVTHKQEYTQAEISAYDQHIPRYFLAAALALVIGSFHIIVKSVPGFWQWLWQAGYGGHLFRDLANSHIIIVGGGTVLLTGLTWYVLPRITNRPLYSASLAGASFWFTVIGVFGFYLAWLILGIVEGNMVSHGWDYMAAKEALGAWHRLPTRLTSSIMGVGYWTYVLNVFLTVWSARYVVHKPFGYLTKFMLVSAAALFVGTVQGVLQVLPANADWIHYAGKFGEYIDPISHAHVNLVTGMMVALVGLLAYFSPRMGGRPIEERTANRIFWLLVPGSLAFYLTFLLLGLILGGAANGKGGIQIPLLVPFLSKQMPVLLSIAGSLMLSGFWAYFLVLWRGLRLRTLRSQIREGSPSAFWLISSLALVVGTFQGLLQLLPPSMRIFTTAEEIPNIHAQLNMIGGIMLALIGLVYLLLPELVGQPVEPRLARLSLYGITGGIAGYYLATLVIGMTRFGFLQGGMDDAEAAVRLGWVAPATLLLTALPMLAGFASFGVGVLRSTQAYRAQMATGIFQAPAKFSGPMPARLMRIPIGYVLGMELAGGLLGWPGIGWLYAGQAMPAIALLLIGPSVAWAMFPMLFSPFTGTPLSQWGWPVLLVWLLTSALASSSLLARYLRRSRAGGGASSSMQIEQIAQSPSHRSIQSRIPRRKLIGISLVMMVLFSIPLIPLGTGISKSLAGQPVLSELPDRANGAYISVSDGARSGLIKLFAWSFPLNDFPQESPSISPNHIQGLFISQKGLDDPTRYHLFHLDDGDQIPLQEREVSFQHQLQLIPKERLLTGNYLLDVPSGGMFAGREYYYFRLDPAAINLPPLADLPKSGSPNNAASLPVKSALGSVSWLEVLPLSSAVISAWMAITMIRRIRQKFRPQEAAWSLAFLMFAIAAGCQVVGDLAGWTPTLARLYYVNGATLVVGWLGLGTWLVLVHRPWLRNAGLWAMILLSGYGAGLVSLSPVDSANLAVEGWRALSKPPSLTVLTIAVNSLGTVMLVGAALWSAWAFWRKGIMRERMVGLILLAVGALVVAAGGGLTRLGHAQYLYIAMSFGISLMFWGYHQTIRPASMHTESVPVPQ